MIWELIVKLLVMAKLYISMSLGLFFLVIAVIGIVRFKDVYTRQHAAGLIETGGAFFTMLSLAMISGFDIVSVKPILLSITLMGMSPPLTYVFMQILKKHSPLPCEEKKTNQPNTTQDHSQSTSNVGKP